MVGTACFGITMICQESCPAGAMTKNTGQNLQRCWRCCFMECRDLLAAAVQNRPLQIHRASFLALSMPYNNETPNLDLNDIVLVE